MKNFLILLIGILTLTAILRLYKLGSIPPGFANDEAAITYQAFSILKTGKDTWGKRYPLLSFKDFGEYLPPFSVYAQIPFIYLFGLNEFGTRIPSALSAILSIIPLFYLTKNLFKNNKISLLACFLFAISPLNIGWSRFVYEGNFGMMFYLFGLMFYTYSWKKPTYLIHSLVFFGLTFTTYHIYFLITPITLLLIFFPRIPYLMSKNKNLFIKLIFISSLIFIYYFLIIASGSGRERFRQVSIFNKAFIVQDLNTKRFYCMQYIPNVICKILFNKGTAYLSEYSYNYLFHFSPTYLVLNGTFLRGTILPYHGLIYPFELVSFYLGIILLFTKRNKTSYILLVWLFLYPAANSFTGVGEISRITHAMPLFSIVSGFGLYYLFKIVSKFKYGVALNFIICLIVVFNIVNFLINYFTIFPKTNSKNGSFAYVNLFKLLSSQPYKYNRYFISSQYFGFLPSYQARIFLPIAPEVFQEKERNDFIIQQPERYIDYRRLDNFYFVNDFDNYKITSTDLLVLTKDQLKSQDRVKFKIEEPSGETSLFGIERDLISK